MGIPQEGEDMKRAVITAVGKDSVGRFAEICNYLAGKKINILDVSQTLIGGFFNIMLIVDITEVDNEFASVVDGFMKLGEKCDFKANIQREEIFDQMHRI
ncbi:ACT domain protein [Catonella morbi ATCC 51271]|jgi:hypothetical protein|uniref:ACT domain protein n=2 Tax=Catonella TaxID=43996 RepID=V2XQG5_9FIRM|nr:ACT domain protein [Catonella morbi ATCC 51271]